ncbi:high-affinity branched-chain amino acid ABC transporter permease LivM [Zavarzinia sp. CC-PAN008]|uniref:high-affinity branched-chain amino acid ABC transporter permease LivM n=1 Tax=Zavarzinia sp. CC-PAN008 TaxID=3243332 RepID=UPI003F74A62A
MAATMGGGTLQADLRDAVLVGIIAFLIGLPIIGLPTTHLSGQDLGITTRFGELLLGVGLVMLGRFGGSAMAHGRRGLIAALALPVLLAAAVPWIIQYRADAACLALRAMTPPDPQACSAHQAFAARWAWPSAFLQVVAFFGAAGLLLQALFKGRGIRVSAGVLDRLGPVVGPMLFVLALALPVLWWAVSTYVLDIGNPRYDIGILVFTYIMLGWGLNIVVGLAGLLDLGYVAFYAVGAYSYALFAAHFGWGFWICLPLAGLLAALFGIMLGLPVLRLRGDYLAIVTLGFGEIIYLVLQNWYQFTGGPNGLSSIPRPSFFGLPFTAAPPADTTAFHQFFDLTFSPRHREIFLYYLILALAMVVNLFTIRMRRLPTGRAWEALREDEVACRALGLNPTTTKLTAFALGAMFAGFAGAFFATRQGFISPESFTFTESAIILAIVVLGGLGSQLGVVIATLLIIGLPEALRELKEYRMLAFGVGMVLIMVLRPRGLLARREPTIRLRG